VNYSSSFSNFINFAPVWIPVKNPETLATGFATDSEITPKSSKILLIFWVDWRISLRMKTT